MLLDRYLSPSAHEQLSAEKICFLKDENIKPNGPLILMVLNNISTNNASVLFAVTTAEKPVCSVNCKMRMV